LGTPEFAVPSLDALIQSPQHEVVCLITQPDRKAGRGQQLTPPPTKVLAEKHGVPIFQFQRLRKSPEALTLLGELRPDLCVVVAFGQILEPEFFDLPPHGTLNVHASLLPAYRGAAPIVHAILNGESESGVTIMKIDAGMDTGDVLSEESVQIPENMTAGELEKLLAVKGADLLLRSLDGYLKGSIEPVPQDHDLATYAPRFDKGIAHLDWGVEASRVHNTVRALNPWPGATFKWQGKEVKLWRTRLVAEHLSRGPQPPGSVVEIRRGSFLVRCGNDTVIELGELQLPNRKRVSAKDFLNGCQLKVGDLLT
jgi:methionyl-tRNA formyltransferase